MPVSHGPSEEVTVADTAAELAGYPREDGAIGVVINPPSLYVRAGSWFPIGESPVSEVTNPHIFEDFVSGDVSGDAPIGDLGWRISGGGATASAVAPSSGTVGVLSFETFTNIGTYAVLYLRESPHVGVVPPASMFDLTFVARLVQADGDTLCRFGLANDATANPPGDGIFFEKLTSDSSWFGVTRSGGTQTRTAALRTADTAWIRGRIRRVDGSTVAFSLGEEASANATVNIPTAALQPFVAIRNSTTASKKIEVDYMDLLITGLRP
jgi:hypothetical protein